MQGGLASEKRLRAATDLFHMGRVPHLYPLRDDDRSYYSFTERRSLSRTEWMLACLDWLGVPDPERLQGLRPVQFTCKPEFSQGVIDPQYGLIAEEVAEVDPNLAITVDGRVESVRYQFLAPLLVAEVQRLETERASLARELAALRAIVEQLQRQLQTQATERQR